MTLGGPRITGDDGWVTDPFVITAGDEAGLFYLWINTLSGTGTEPKLLTVIVEE